MILGWDSRFGGHIFFTDLVLIKTKMIKVICSKSDHLRAVPHFSYAYGDCKNFGLFFRERQMNSPETPSGFVIFQAFLNYL